MDSSPVVCVVDDDPAMRKSLKWLIESVGVKVQTYSSAAEFLSQYDDTVPGCLVLDVRMPEMGGLDLQEKLQRDGVEIPVIIITGFADVPMAVRAMKAGAIDFVEKPVSDQILLDLIHRAIARDSERREKQEASDVVAERMATLTKREREVMRFVVDGFSSKEIAADLGVSFKTIEAHRAKIMKKMQAKSVPHLIHMNITVAKQ